MRDETSETRARRSEQGALRARAAVTLAAAALCLAAVAPALLESLDAARGARVFRAAFAPVCHQMPARSFTLAGRTLAVCQRCSGIYAGIVLGALAAWLALTPRPAAARAGRRRLAIAACTLPMILDVALELAGARHATPLARAATGVLFGFMLSTFFSEGVAELARRAASPSLDHARLRS